MAQHDYNLANQPGAAFRADLNSALQAAATQNSGPAEPATTYPYQLWADSSTQMLKQRNAANNGWVELFNLATGQPASIGQLDGMRNKIINGNFGVNQRGVPGTVTLAAGAYGHDRWKAGASGCTYTYATTQNVTTITITSGSLVQVIEGLNLQSGTHVLSWQGTAQGRVDGGAYGESGGLTGTAVGGTNQTIEFNAGTVRLVQYEPGTVATPFDHRPYGEELELCRRYLYPLYRPGASSDTIGYGGMFRSSIGQVLITGTRLRANPTILGVPLILVGATTGGSTAITAVELLASGDVFLLTSAGSYTAQPAFLAKNANANATLPTFLSAEL